MLNTNTQLREIGNEIWTFQTADAFLYNLCTELENPSNAFAQNDTAFSTTEDDWTLHFCSDFSKLEDVPLRLLVIHKALKGYSELFENSPEKLVLVQETIQNWERTGRVLARKALVDLLNSDEQGFRKNAVQKLFLHLATDEELGARISMQELDLGGDLHAGAIASRLAIFKNLEKLILKNCGLIDEDLQFLTKMPALKELDLSNNRVSSIGLQFLHPDVSLLSLKMIGTRINSIGLVNLNKMKSLNTLALPSVGFEREVIEALQRALPDCQITVDE